MRKNHRFSIFMGLAMMLLSGLALAQTAQTVNIDQITAATQRGDWSMQIWESIFGTFARSPFSPGLPNTLLGNLFITFNAAVFTIGTAWLGYGVVSGIVGTAQDGQALGQRINSAWYPIRVVTGIGGMLPIMGGYTVSQAVLMSIAALGIGTANLMWNGAVNSPALTAMISSEAFTSKQILNRSDVMEAAATMFKSHICMIHSGRQLDEMTSSGATLGPRDQLIYGPAQVANGIKYSYGSVADPESCGSVTFTMSAVRNADNAFAYRLKSVDYAAIRAAAVNILSGRLATLDANVKALADEYVARNRAWNATDKTVPLDFDPKSLTRLVDAYLSETQQAVSPLVAGKTEAVTTEARVKMEASGWIGAGSFYGTFAEANAALADAVSGGRMTARPPSEARIFSEAAMEVAQAQRYIEKSVNDDSKTAVFCSAGFNFTGMIGTETGNCSLGQGIVSAVIGATMRGTGGGTGGALMPGADNVGLVNPLIGMKNAGDYIMTVANVLILYDRANNAKIDISEGPIDAVGNLINKAGASTVKQIPVVGTLLDELAPFGWMLLALGALLAIYVPFLPLIAWVGGMISYTASFIEGLVAMPLHSMSHMHTDGEGLGSQTSHGYLFFLNTFARPPLMVISFFIAGGLVIALGTVVTMMFLPAMANVQGNSMTGVASIIGFVVIYFVLMNVIINGCFDLIHIIPDQVIGFVGSGNINTKLGSDAENKINALYMAGVRGGQSAGQSNISRAAQRAATGAREKLSGGMTDVKPASK